MKFILLLLLSTSTFWANAQMTLVWSDEFNADSLDTDKWISETGGWGWGNNELQYYTNGDNLSFANGNLIITAREEQFGSNNYTSGKIITEGLYDVRYGRIEASLKVPMGQGLWPAFWMLGSNIDAISWPYCGEIDVMEHINNESQTHGTAHWDNGGHVYYGNSVSLNPAEYHLYAIEWSNTSIVWSVDGNVYHTMNITNGLNGTGEFQLSFYLILNLAVGGNWPGNPNGSTTFPAELSVDYVRVYKNDTELSIAENALEEISVFPNPSAGAIQFTLPGDCSLKVYAIDGTLVYEKAFIAGAQQLDVSAWNSGVYFLNFEDAALNRQVVRFVKE